MKTFHVQGKAHFKNSKCDGVDYYVPASDGNAALRKVEKFLSRGGYLSSFELTGLLTVGLALPE